MEKKEIREIPKSIVIVLLVLTVIISILGTWTVLDEMENAKAAPAAPSKDYANVRLFINNVNAPQSSSGDGKVTLRILEAE